MHLPIILLLVLAVVCAASSSLAKRLAGIGEHYLITALNGDLFAVGRNARGELGLNLTEGSVVDFPQQVTILPGGGAVLDVAVGGLHSIILLAPNRVVACSGDGEHGQLAQGEDSFANSAVFLPVAGELSEGGAREVFAGDYSTFVIANRTDKVYAWGSNGYGRLGVNSTEDKVLVPTLVAWGEENDRIIQVGAGNEHSCFLTSTGRVLCTGANYAGQIGVGALDNDRDHLNVPQAVVLSGAATTPTFVSVSAGAVHTCASDATGALWCWGSNEYGSVGQLQSGPVNYNLPTLVAGAQHVAYVWAGTFNTFAVLTNGSALAFGADYYGLFGNDEVPFGQFSPIAFAQGLGGIHEIRGGLHTACVLTTANEVWCAGKFSSKQLGPELANSSVLVQMQGLPTAAPTTLAPTKSAARVRTSSGSSVMLVASSAAALLLLLCAW